MIKVRVLHSDGSLGPYKEWETVEECREFFIAYGGYKNIECERKYVIKNDNAIIGFSDHPI
jgi:hypothetical protein